MDTLWTSAVFLASSLWCCTQKRYVFVRERAMDTLWTSSVFSASSGHVVVSLTCSSASAVGACSSVSCNANFFDTIGDAADGCEAPCGAADNRVCNTCSAAAASACSSVTCNANFLDTNGETTDGCEAPGSAGDGDS